MDKLHVRCSKKGQNASKNASERASNLTEICFRPGGGFAPLPGPPTMALPWTHWRPRRPKTPCLLCFHIVIGLATPLAPDGWMDVLKINIDLAIFQPYLDLEKGDNQSLKIQVARLGMEPRSSCSSSQELNHSATAASDNVIIIKFYYLYSGI